MRTGGSIFFIFFFLAVSFLATPAAGQMTAEQADAALEQAYIKGCAEVCRVMSQMELDALARSEQGVVPSDEVGKVLQELQEFSSVEITLKTLKEQPDPNKKYNDFNHLTIFKSNAFPALKETMGNACFDRFAVKQSEYMDRDGKISSSCQKALEVLTDTGKPALWPSLCLIKQSDNCCKNIRRQVGIENFERTTGDKIDINSSFEIGMIVLAKLKDKRAIAPLLDELKTGKGRRVIRILEVLALLPDERIVEPAIARLHDGDGEIRERAVKTLGAMKDARAVPPLMEILTDPNESIRQSAGEALGKVGDASIAPKLIEGFNATDPKMQNGYAIAIASLNAPGAYELLTEKLYVQRPEGRGIRRNIVEALGYLNDDRAVPVLAELLQYSFVSEDAIRTSKNPKILPYLIEGLKNKDAKYRTKCADLMVGFKDDRAADALLEAAVNETDDQARSKARWAYLENPQTRHSEKFLSEIKKKDCAKELRKFYLDALIALREPRAKEIFIQGLYDDNTCMKCSTVLADMNAVDAVEPIIISLKRSKLSEGVLASRCKKHIDASLFRLTGVSFGEDYSAWMKWWKAQKKTEEEKNKPKK